VRNFSRGEDPLPLLVTPSLEGLPGVWFDRAAVEKVVLFFERHLRHVKGRWAGLPFCLEGWQVEYVIGPIFGWKNAGGAGGVGGDAA